MKSFLLSVAFLVTAVLSVEASKTPRTQVPPEFLQNADVVVLDDIERVKYNIDGTYTSVAQMRILILTERGRKLQSTQTISYNRRYGEAKFEEIALERLDGSVDKIDISKLVKDTTDNSSMQSNIVDPHDRKVVCNVPGVKVGDIVSLKVTRKTYNSRVENEFADCFVIEGTSPSITAYYEVTAPKALPIKKAKVRNPIGNVVESTKTLDDGSIVHIFAATNTPRMFPEDSMPDVWTKCQHILLSTVGDWKDFSRWYWNLSLPHIEKATPAVTNMALKLKTPINIFRFVSQEIRYMGLTMEDKSPGYAPHDVNITFENRYGVCRDKAALLVAMLRIAGHKAFPVLINVGAKLDESVPLPFFNHAIVALENKDGSLQLMDPTNENTKDPMPSYLCNLSYLVARPEGDELRVSGVPNPLENSVFAKTRASLNKDAGMVVVSEISFLGINDTAYRGAFARFSKDERALFFEKRLKKLSPSAELIDYEIQPSEVRDTSKPLKVKLTAKVPGMAVKGEKFVEIKLPLITQGIGILRVLIDGCTSLEKRKYPLVIDTTAHVEEDLEIDLGEYAGEVVSLPTSGKAGEGFVYERNFNVKNGKLSLRRALTLNKMEFSVSEYHMLKNSLKEFDKTEKDSCIFKRNINENADTKLISKVYEVYTQSDYDWVETNEFVREVLTYNGLKSSSEVEIDFHPSIAEIEVLNAVVSNKTGKVFKLSPKEINLMDASWAAASPRYEAGKKLIVNLPGVEKGSIITLKIARKIRNSPVPFLRTWYFDSFEPAQSIKLIINSDIYDIKNPKRLREEQYLPAGKLWRNSYTLSAANWQRHMQKMRKASIVEPCKKVEGTIEEIRKFMARNVRVIGPSLYAMPLEKHITAPERVLQERYASRLDYIRTLVSLLNGSGYDAKVVFAENSDDTCVEERKLNKESYPNPSYYAKPFCLVKTPKGNAFIGVENEYTPIGATSMDGAEYYDPMDGKFGFIKSLEGLEELNKIQLEYDLDEKGDADLKYNETIYGSMLGLFRKRYKEMLPEDRFRHYMNVLDEVSTSAKAISPLKTDVDSYPGIRSYECKVSAAASQNAGIMSFNLERWDVSLPQISAESRDNPISINGTNDEEETILIKFPYGYSSIEHMPRDVKIDFPTGGEWISVSYTNFFKQGRLNVLVKRTVKKRPSIILGHHYAKLITSWREELLSAPQNIISAVSAEPVKYGIDGRRNEWKRTSLSALIKRWNLDETKVPKYTLPDPLESIDGRNVDSQKWRESRRLEILEKLAIGEYGYQLPSPTDVTYEVLNEKKDALEGLATRREILMRFKGTTGKTLEATMLLYIPNKTKVPAPIFLGLNFRGNHATTLENDVIKFKVDFEASPKSMKGPNFTILKNGYDVGSAARRWPYKEIIERGYAVATVCYHDFYPDFIGVGRSSVFALFMDESLVDGPQIKYTPIGAWAWGLSRMLDYVTLEPRIDASRAAVIGHSRLGKTALWAGAIDERFGLVCPNNSGCGGVALHKREFGENIESHLSHRDNCQDAFWFTEAFAESWATEKTLKFDQHEAVSLIAPRAIAVGVATKDIHADPKGEYESLRAAKDVWSIFNKKVSLPEKMPQAGTQILGPISFHVREGKHDLLLEDWNKYMNAADLLWGENKK